MAISEKRRCGLGILGLSAFAVAVSCAEPLEWSKLKPLPDEYGFAGPFAGVSNDALIVAGGANFPEGYPWDDGTKIWHDRIFVLEKGDGDWKLVDTRLPRPGAYGVSVSVPSRKSVIFIGGNDTESSYADVYEARWENGDVNLQSLPSLPVASAMGAGALLGNAVYFIGGSPGNGTALKRFFKLELSMERLAWESLSWPEGAAGRILSVVGVSGGRLYLFGGADLGSDKWDKRTYLNDAWAYDPSPGTWKRIADLPRQATAAPSLAIPAGQSHLLLLGGASREFVDKQLAARPDKNGAGEEHPGFPKGILVYHTITNTWVDAGSIPEAAWAPVTTTAVAWNDQIVVPTGEIKPGIRSPQVLAATVAPTKKEFGVINWIIVAVYLGGMIVIGYWFSKRNASTDDYFRGGQRVPWWVAGLSIFATMLSALTFMGIPARAYATDMSWYIGQIPILLVVPIVVCFYLPYFRKLDITSAYEYLENRFNLTARLFGSMAFILFHIGRVAIVLYLPALALAQVSSINVIACIVIIGVLCMIYTVMGGIEAVVWTDAVQAIVLMGGAVLCLVLVFFRVDGGIAEVWNTSVADAKLFQSLSADFDIANGTTSMVVLFVAFFFNSLVPYTSGQDVVQRYVTTRDERAARRSLWTTMWMSVFGSLVFFALGAAIYAFYRSQPALLDPAMSSSDGILPFFILQQLPVGVAGLIIAAIFAASQSTVSSSLNSVATAYVTDFHARIFRPDNPDAKNLFVARLVVVLLGVVGITVACIMAKSQIESAFKTFNKMIGLTAGALGGLFGLGVFNKRANGTGALVGAAAGFAVVVTLWLAKSPVSGLLYAFIGFAICFIVGSVVSMASPSPKKDE